MMVYLCIQAMLGALFYLPDTSLVWRLENSDQNLYFAAFVVS